MIRITFDKKGFPMARVRKVGAFHFWPVTKYQYRQFLDETGQNNDAGYNAGYKAGYKEMLELNPEIHLEKCNADNYEGLFITGVKPEEAQAYAQWMGEEYDIPTLEEWLALYNAVKSHKFMIRLSPYGLNPEARAMSKQLKFVQDTVLNYSFLMDGIVEWIKQGPEFCGRGAPRDSFFPNVWNPEEDDIKVISLEHRLAYFGFRLIKRAPMITGMI